MSTAKLTNKCPNCNNILTTDELQDQICYHCLYTPGEEPRNSNNNRATAPKPAQNQHQTDRIR